MAGTRDYDNVDTGNQEETLSLINDPSQDVDSASTGAEETSYNNPDWATYNGFYRQYPEIKAQVDKLALWSVGKGYNADSKTMKILFNSKKTTINEDTPIIYIIVFFFFFDR